MKLSNGNLALVTAAILAGLSVSRVTSAQETDGFFRENYPKDFRLDNLKPTPRTRTTPRPTEKAPVSTKPSTPSPSEPNATPTAPAVDSALDAKSGAKVVSIGLVSSAMDKEHLRENLETMSSAMKRYDLVQGAIWMIGPKKAYDRLELEQMMGEYSLSLPDVTKNKPVTVDIKLSPTWILHTTEGRVLLEGLKLERYINSRGEFVE